MTDQPLGREADARSARETIVRTIVGRETDRLVAERGIAWRFVEGRAFTSGTHSRWDVRDAAVRLAEALKELRLLPPESIPLVELAAAFHASGDGCGSGAAPARAAMLRWPALFDAADVATVIEAIEGLAPADPSGDGPAPLAPLQATAARLGTGLTEADLAELSTAQRVAAVLADADRAYLAQVAGPHRVLLHLIEAHADQLSVPWHTTGVSLAPDAPVVQGRLAEAIDVCAGHRWVLAMSDRTFDRRELNVERLRAMAAAHRDGVSWRELLTQTIGWTGVPV